jgi:hypothetical protein
VTVVTQCDSFKDALNDREAMVRLKSNIRQNLYRLTKPSKKLPMPPLEALGNGEYRYRAEELAAAKAADLDRAAQLRATLLRKYKDEPGETGQFLKIPTPLWLNEYLKFPPGSMVMIAGVASTAKTIMGMQWAAALRELMEVYYFQRELSKGERADRRSNLEAHLNLPLGTLENEINWIRPRSLDVLDARAMDDLAQMITPGAAVFVDYLQISDQFYRIGEVLPKLAHNIGDGLLVIFVQKDRHKPTGRGDSHLEEFPRVVLTLDPVNGSDEHCVLRFRKWKAKAKPSSKLSKLEILYRINETGTAVVPIKERFLTSLFSEKSQKSGTESQQVPPADNVSNKGKDAVGSE